MAQPKSCTIADAVCWVHSQACLAPQLPPQMSADITAVSTQVVTTQTLGIGCRSWSSCRSWNSCRGWSRCGSWSWSGCGSWSGCRGRSGCRVHHRGWSGHWACHRTWSGRRVCHCDWLLSVYNLSSTSTPSSSLQDCFQSIHPPVCANVWVCPQPICRTLHSALLNLMRFTQATSQACLDPCGCHPFLLSYQLHKSSWCHPEAFRKFFLS